MNSTVVAAFCACFLGSLVLRVSVGHNVSYCMHGNDRGVLEKVSLSWLSLTSPLHLSRNRAILLYALASLMMIVASLKVADLVPFGRMAISLVAMMQTPHHSEAMA